MAIEEKKVENGLKGGIVFTTIAIIITIILLVEVRPLMEDSLMKNANKIDVETITGSEGQFTFSDEIQAEPEKDLSEIKNITIDNQEYTLPINFADLEADGWGILTFEDDVKRNIQDDYLEPNERLRASVGKGELKGLTIVFKNFSQQPMIIRDVPVWGISIEQEIGSAVLFVNGVSIESTGNDLKEKLGHPSRSELSKNSQTITYAIEKTSGELGVDFEDNDGEIMIKRIAIFYQPPLA